MLKDNLKILRKSKGKNEKKWKNFIEAKNSILQLHKSKGRMLLKWYEIKKVSGGMFYTEFTISMRCDKIESQW